MSDILAALGAGGFLPFTQLFRPQEGRMGVTVTFVAILELMREGLIDIVQAQPYAPLHVRGTSPARALHIVTDNPQGGEAERAEASAAPAPADEDAS
jgi:segregation and condensation protein A